MLAFRHREGGGGLAERAVQPPLRDLRGATQPEVRACYARFPQYSQRSEESWLTSGPFPPPPHDDGGLEPTSGPAAAIGPKKPWSKPTCLVFSDSIVQNGPHPGQPTETAFYAAPS